MIHGLELMHRGNGPIGRVQRDCALCKGIHHGFQLGIEGERHFGEVSIEERPHVLHFDNLEQENRVKPGVGGWGDIVTCLGGNDATEDGHGTEYVAKGLALKHVSQIDEAMECFGCAQRVSSTCYAQRDHVCNTPEPVVVLVHIVWQ